MNYLRILNEADTHDKLQAANSHITDYMAFGYTSTAYKIGDDVKKAATAASELLKATQALITVSDKIKSIHGGSTEKIASRIPEINNILSKAAKQCSDDYVTAMKNAGKAASDLKGHIAYIQSFVNKLEKLCK